MLRQSNAWKAVPDTAENESVDTFINTHVHTSPWIHSNLRLFQCQKPTLSFFGFKNNVVSEANKGGNSGKERYQQYAKGHKNWEVNIF